MGFIIFCIYDKATLMSTKVERVAFQHMGNHIEYEGRKIAFRNWQYGQDCHEMIDFDHPKIKKALQTVVNWHNLDN